MTFTADPRVDAYIDSLPALTAMFREIIANNRAGGWRKLKQQG
jgi:hypothetical protein